MELLLGAGQNRNKLVYVVGREGWTNLVTLDINPDVKPHVVFDLNKITTYGQLPFFPEEAEEIHAYNVLEHIGYQGEAWSFFREFKEYHRVLKPMGTMHIVVPRHDSVWAWGDPGHRRVLTPQTFKFLDQDLYQEVGITAVTDYRNMWQGNFKTIHVAQDADHYFILLRKEPHASKPI